MKKKVLVWIIILTVVVVALVTIISTQIALSREEERIRELEALREELLADNERLSHDLAAEVDDSYIVRLMRRLGYYFPGEKQLTFTDPKTTEENEE